MKRMKRAIALLLAVAICFGMYPVSAMGSSANADMQTDELQGIHSEQGTNESYTENVEDAVEAEEDPTALYPEQETIGSFAKPVDDEALAPPVDLMSEVAIVASGSCGSQVTWALDVEGKLTISGTGAMSDYGNAANAPWYKHRDKVVSVVVEEGVTYIGILSFCSYYTNLKEVSLPETLTTIGNSAFRECTALTHVTISENVTAIGTYAFQGCTQLKEIVLPDGMTRISAYAFYGCTGLTSVSLPENLKTIGDFAFYCCTGLKEITIPDSVTTIAYNAFRGCTGLTEITLPESLITLGTYAFYECSGLKGTLVIPDQVTSIGGYAFRGCTGLTGLKLGSKVTTIGSSAFQACQNITGELVIPDSVTTIYDYAFNGCKGIVGELVIPDSVTKIYDSAFCNMTGLTSIVVGSGLTQLGTSSGYGYSPFYSCSGVTQITFNGTTAPSIPADIFYSMSRLVSVTVPAEGYTSYAGAFCSNLPASARIQCPDRQDELLIMDDVLVAYLGDEETVVIPEGVTAIGDGAFMNCSTLVSVVIPDSVTRIGSYAFSKCTNLTNIELPDGLTGIGKYAFYNCQKMTTELNLTDLLSELGAYAFYNCKRITGSVYLSDHITVVNERVFYSCTGLNGTLRLPSGLTEIKSAAFYLCKALTGELDFPMTLKTIGSSAFEICSGFTGDLVIPNSVTSLGTYAFNGCSGFNGTLTLSEGLTGIPTSAFQNCSGIVGELVIPESVTSYINGSAFYGMKGLTSVVIGSRVAYLYSAAFGNCSALEKITFTGLNVPGISGNPFSDMTNLKTIYIPAGVFSDYVAKFSTYVPKTARILSLDAEDEFLIEDNVLLSYQGNGGEVVIPENVTSIAAYAFSGCTEVTSITIHDGVTTIGGRAFQGCTGLEDVDLPDGIQTIGNYLFSGCISLTGEMVIPDSVTSIGTYAFQGCTSLTGLNTGIGVVTIGDYAFDGCTSLVDVVIEDSVTTIGKYAFRNCSTLTNLDLGDGVQSIGNYAFQNCKSMEMLKLGNSVTSVGNCAFASCSGMKQLDLGSSVKTIGSHAFDGCTGLTGDLIIPDSVTSISTYAFNCTGLTGTLTLSKGLTSISGYTFNGCTKISGELVIPDSVTMIDDCAFCNLNSLTSIVFGSGLTRIGSSTGNYYNPFFYCNSVTSVTFTGAVPPVLKSNVFYGMSKLETVYVPLASFADYSAALASYLPKTATLKAIGSESDFLVEDGVLVGYLGTDTEIVIPDNVTAIGASVFQNRTDLTAVVIPDTVTSIGDYAFSGCTALTAVELPDAVTSIGSYAFHNCTALTAAELPDAVTSIGNYAFYNCRKLTGELVLPAVLTSIGNYAFYGCTGLTGSLILPDTLISIGSYAFYNCCMLTGELVFPDSVESIGDMAFYHLNKITSITFGTGLKTLGSNSSYSYSPFYGCSGVNMVTFHGETPPVIASNIFISMNLGSVWVPAGSYADYAAIFKDKLTNGRIRGMGATEDFLIEEGVLVAYLGNDAAVKIPEGVTAIGDAAFINNRTMTSVEIPDAVTTIGEYAFYGCSGLNGTLKLPADLTVVNKYAFNKCSKVVGELVIPDGVTTIGDCAFSQMFLVTSIVIGSGVKQIGAYSNYANSPFYANSKLEKLTFTGKLPAIISSAPFSQTNLKLIQVPEAEFTAYLNKLGTILPVNARVVTNEMEDEFLIEDGVLLVYQGLGGDVVIPDGVTAIGQYAFQGCNELTSVTIPEGVTAINEYAFRNCTGLTRIDLPDSLERIGNHAFNNCDALRGTLVIPNGVQTIGDYAFSECDNITALKLGSSVRSIGSFAFNSCDSLTGDLVLPNSLVTLGSYVFQQCTKLNGTLKLSESMTTIPYYGFYGAPLSGELVIPDSVTKIDGYAFRGSTGLESVVIGAGVKQMETNPFYGCNGIKTMMFLGSDVPTFYNNIFASMSKLETVYVPADAYDAYKAAFGTWLGTNVEISTDFITAKINNLTAERVYSKTIVLSWSSHTSSSVVGYNIYCNGEIIGTTSGCTYAVRDLMPETSYTYTVQGFAEDGRTTGATQITATTVLPEIKDIKTVSTANKINELSNTITIYVTNRGNLMPMDEENTVCSLYSDDIPIGNAILQTDMSNGNTAVYTLNWDMKDFADGEHDVRVVLTDIDGTSDAYSETLIIDRGIPAQIVGVTAFGDHDVLHINWAVAAETDTHIYRIYRRTETDGNYRLIAQINDRNILTYTDSNIKKDRVYYYYVVGVNELNQEGVPSLVVAATLAPDTQPPVVTKLTPQNGTYLKNTVRIAVTAEDDISLGRAELYYSRDDGKNWILFAQLSVGTFHTDLDTTKLSDGVIRIRAIAYDAAENASAPLEYIYFIDNHGPEKVQGLSYESTNVSITLRWNDVSNEDISYYRVEQRDDEGNYTTVANVYSTLGVNIYDLTPGTKYTYRVVGYDQQGNRGTPSDDIEAYTLSDTIAPVITRIRPLEGYYADVIPLVITAKDEYRIRSITIQVSLDRMSWKDVFVQNYVGVLDTQVLSYDLELKDYEEGAVYVRAIARDGGGNTSDTGVNAPFVQYIVDRTAPGTPENVKAIGQCGYIQISWKQGPETDLNGYSVYRSESMDGEYVLLAEGLKSIDYYDRDVTEDTVYYYKVAVKDKAGNRSEFAPAVYAEVGEDTEAPVIVTIYPASGSLMGVGNNAVGVTATDNHMLKSLHIEYSADGIHYKTMYDLEDITDYGQYADAIVPVEEFEDGDTVYLKVTAADQSGNVSEPFAATYTIDAVAPAASNAEAVYISEDENVEITWIGAMEPDLYGYRIYRIVDETATLVGFSPAVTAQSNYSFADNNLPITRTHCTYMITAVDKCGNTSDVLTESVLIPDRQYPRAILYCDNTMEVGVEYAFDASASTDNESIVSYFIDFGDGITTTESNLIHVYEKTGEYTVSLTVEDNDGHVTTVSKTITVVDRSAIGTVKIQIVDENGRAVPNAPVYFDLGEETQTMKITDSTGCAIFTSTAGVHAVGCVIPNNEWLPAKKDVIILAASQTTVTMTLVHQPMIEGVFEVNRMTFEEIVAAGIDVSKPENQHIVSVDVKLTYGSSEQKTSFIFNMVTKEAIGETKYDCNDDGAVDREIVPVLLSNDSIAYLDLPIGASLLKEFFDVRLTIINNASSEFSMLNNVITLNVPEGLSIVEAASAEGDATVEVKEIPGQTSTTISWILRGDQEGVYSLSADYSGLLSQFEEPIHTTFLSKEPIQVYGLSAIKMIAEVNSSVNFDAFYFNLAMENVSSVDVNLPSIQIEDHVLTSYLKRVYYIFEKDGPQIGTLGPTVSEPIVRHLNTILSNSSGFNQYIGTETALQTLAAGEKLVNQYVAYNVSGYNNLMLLKEAIYEIAEGYGIQFELIETDMDLFSIDHASDKMADVKNDSFKKDQYSEILNCSRYFYVLESLGGGDNAFIFEGDQLYAKMKKVLDVDNKYSADATNAVTRAIVAQLMVDESMQQAIKTAVDGKYLEVTTALLNKIGTQLTGEDLTVWNNYVGAADKIRTLTDKLEKFGLARFVEYLIADLTAVGISEEGITRIRGYYSDGEMGEQLGAAVADVCMLVSAAVEKLNSATDDWTDSAEIVTNLIRIAAAQQEIHVLLDLVSDHTDDGGSVQNAVEIIRSDLGKVEAQLAFNFGESLNRELAEDIEINTAILNCLDSVYGAGTGPSYTLVKLTFGAVENVLNWSGITTDQHVLSMCTEISLALRQAVEQYGLDSDTDEKAVYTLNALKYLIKMRLIGEQCFVNAVGHRNVNERIKALNWVNATNQTAYKTLTEYLTAIQVRLLTFRDNIFASYYTNLDIPAAPEVTIDYLTSATVEKFSSDYEYSFEGSVWYECTDTTIAFTPATVNRYLWVRMKETDSTPAGNITKVVIPAMSRITGDITMIYIEGGYQISGLKAGTYLYAFTNDRSGVTMEKCITVKDGEVVKILEENDDWTFIALGTAATDDAFASQIRYVAAERPWVIDTDTYLITGKVEKTTSLQLIYYYESKGYMVTVYDADGNTTEMVGTGCVVNLDGQAHKAVVSGDVNGDGLITMDDLFGIMDHINSDEVLMDEYFQAGRFLENEDIDLFDLWAELNYINSKSDSTAD